MFKVMIILKEGTRRAAEFPTKEKALCYNELVKKVPYVYGAYYC